MDIKLVALDLDGTLLRRDTTISQANIEACRAIMHRGVRLVLASGRTPVSMGRYAEQLGLEGPDARMVCSNGAQVIAVQGRRVVRESRMGLELALRVAAAVESAGFSWQIYEHGTIMTSRMSWWTEMDSRLCGYPVQVVEDRVATFTPGVLKFVIAGDRARPEAILSFKEALEQAFGTQIGLITGPWNFIEVLPPGVDKGVALASVAAEFDLPMSAVLAVGDGDNDLGMLGAVGYPCVPANAVAGAKALARYESPFKHEEDAVAEILARFVLQ